MITEYTKFEDYFKNTFVPKFERTESILNSAKDDMLYEEFITLFGVSFLLLKYYLQNNGIFQFREKDVLREAFYIEFLEHGEEWMLLEQIRTIGTPEEIVKAFKTYFFLFVDLKNKFRGLVWQKRQDGSIG